MAFDWLLFDEPYQIRRDILSLPFKKYTAMHVRNDDAPGKCWLTIRGVCETFTCHQEQHQCKPGVSKLRPGGQMRPADYFESALSKLKKYNVIWTTNETCACLILYFLNINVNILHSSILPISPYYNQSEASVLRDELPTPISIIYLHLIDFANL